MNNNNLSILNQDSTASGNITNGSIASSNIYTWPYYGYPWPYTTQTVYVTQPDEFAINKTANGFIVTHKSLQYVFESAESLQKWLASELTK